MIYEITSILIGIVVGFLAGVMLVFIFKQFQQGNSNWGDVRKLAVFISGSDGVPVVLMVVIPANELSYHLCLFVISETVTFLIIAIFTFIVWYNTEIWSNRNVK